VTTLTLPDDIAAAIEGEWRRISAPGTVYTGAQRVEIAVEARLARAEVDSSQGRSSAGARSVLADAESDVVRAISTDAGSIRQPFVADVIARGVTYPQYVEIMALVSRLTAVDTLLFGCGIPEKPLPTPVDGAPSGPIDEAARIDGGWVPTVGAAFATTALTLLPDEIRAWHELHGALYLSLKQMGSLDIVRDLSRDQIETVAARTSLINECFF
jgi:hypothetical protein